MAISYGGIPGPSGIAANVAVSNFPAEQGTNLNQVGGTAIAAGHSTMAASLPAVIASDQTAFPVNASATGNVASGAADSGDPVKVGGRYNAAAPTLTDGQRGDLQLDSAGKLLVNTGSSSGNEGVVSVAPTISTSAYVAGYNVGGLLSLAGALRVAAGTGYLVDIEVSDHSNQKAPLVVEVFSAAPTAPTDHAAMPTYSTADNAKRLCHVAIAAADWTTVGGSAVVNKVLNAGVNAGSGTTLYAVVSTSGTPTYAGSTDLQFTFKFAQN